MKKFLFEVAECLALTLGGIALTCLVTLNYVFEMMRIARYFIIKGIQKIVIKLKPDTYWCGRWNRVINKISKSDVNYGSKIYDLKISSKEQEA